MLLISQNMERDLEQKLLKWNLYLMWLPPKLFLMLQ